MRKYETIVVLEPTLSEADLKVEVQRLQGVLEARGATQVTVEIWGKKEISYLVKRHRQGYYVCFKFEHSSAERVEEITNILRIDERVIKFQTHRIKETSRKFKGNPNKVPNPEAFGDDALSAETDY